MEELAKGPGVDEVAGAFQQHLVVTGDVFLHRFADLL
jgi:hypothetical protein